VAVHDGGDASTGGTREARHLSVGEAFAAGNRVSIGGAAARRNWDRIPGRGAAPTALEETQMFPSSSQRLRAGLKYGAPTVLKSAGGAASPSASPPPRRLTENMFRVEFDSVFFQQGDKFGVEIHFLVMLFLIPNVTNRHGNHRGAYAECSITFLPRKLVALFRSPSRGI